MKFSEQMRWLLISSGTVLITLVLGFLLILYSGPPTQQEWLKQKASELKCLTITPEMIAASPPWMDIGTDSEPHWMILLGSEGIIPIGTGDWVYFMSHSTHENENASVLRLEKLKRLLMGDHYHPPIGDMMIAIDKDGKLYTNNGHVCNRQLMSDKPVTTVEAFIQTQAPVGNTWQSLEMD